MTTTDAGAAGRVRHTSDPRSSMWHGNNLASGDRRRLGVMKASAGVERAKMGYGAPLNGVSIKVGGDSPYRHSSSRVELMDAQVFGRHPAEVS